MPIDKGDFTIVRRAKTSGTVIVGRPIRIMWIEVMNPKKFGLGRFPIPQFQCNIGDSLGIAFNVMQSGRLFSMRHVAVVMCKPSRESKL